MTTEEIVKTLRTAKSEVEWECPMDYAAAIDEAIEAVYVRDELTETMKLLLLGEGITETGLRLLLENAKNRAKMEGIMMWNEFKLTPNGMKDFGILTLTKEEIQNQQGYYWEYNREEGGYFVFRKEVVSAIEYFTEMAKRFPNNTEVRKHCDTARKALIYLLHDVFGVFEDKDEAKENSDEARNHDDR